MSAFWGDFHEPIGHDVTDPRVLRAINTLETSPLVALWCQRPRNRARRCQRLIGVVYDTSEGLVVLLPAKPEAKTFRYQVASAIPARVDRGSKGLLHSCVLLVDSWDGAVPLRCPRHSGAGLPLSLLFQKVEQSRQEARTVGLEITPAFSRLI